MSDKYTQTQVDKFNETLDFYLSEIDKIDVKSGNDAREVVNLLRKAQYCLMGIDFGEMHKKEFLQTIKH